MNAVVVTGATAAQRDAIGSVILGPGLRVPRNRDDT
jgi:hypothetical protein